MYDYHLSDPTLTTWTLIRQSWSAMNKAAEGKLAKVGLTPERLNVLWLCRDYRGKLIPAELSRLTFRENQTIAGMLNRMESEGLVRRVPKRKGKPFTEVQITDKGKEAVGPGIEVLNALITNIMSSLSVEDHEQLQRILRVIQNNLVEELRLELKPPPGYAPAETVPVNW